MAFISLIIPVYKVERYLRDCLSSILNWDFSDWEVILVDDGSPDNSGIICDEYAAKDKRIRVIHKSNEGVSVARNTGLDIAQGEWCWFVDSDDVINSNTPVNKDLLKDKDIIIFDIKVFKDEDKVPSLKEFTSYDICEDINTFYTKYISYTHQTHWYNRKFWAKDRYNIRFTDGIKLGEDLEFMRKCELLAIRPIKVNHTNYYYRLREDSAYHQVGIDQQVINDTFKVMENLYNFIIENRIIFLDGYLLRFIRLATCIPSHALKGKLWNKQLQNEFRNLVKKYRDISIDLTTSRYIWIATKMPWLLKFAIKFK